MANIVNKKLSIDKNNIEQYCDAQNVSFNVSDHAWRKWLNGSTDGYVILKSEGKAVLYPTETARPFKADSLISASRSAGTCTVDLQFGGVQVHNESYTSGTQKHKSKANITDSAVTNSTKATEIKWHVYGKNGDNQRGDLIELTLYFNQYSAQALIGNGANGVQSVSVSSFAPYYGDTITFGVKLVQGATFDGWYSDSACTQLVSTDTTYSIAPTADVTLYAKATTDATLYNVSAVAGSEIPSVNVSDSIVPEGGTATFTAQVNTGCSFEAWYLDDTYTTVVSTENPYTATIIADTALYAKARRNSLNMSVGSAEHGTASVSATTVPYGSDVTFTFTPEDETWELYGWYSDSGLTQLVSEANPYTFTATEDMALYPKVGRIRYTITLTTAARFHDSINKIMSYDYSLLTDIEKTYLKTGEFDKIEQSKIFEQQTVIGQWIETKTASVQCPLGYAISIYLQGNEAVVMYISRDNIDLTAWPYYTTFPTEDQEYLAIKGDDACYCKAVMVDGILSADATTPVSQGKEAIFTAKIAAGYTFSGWYSDRACTTLVSMNNPAKVATPKHTGDNNETTSLTLYAKATKATYTIGVGTAEHGSATVSKSTAYYGDTVTFNCVVDEGYEFKGWYSDEELTQFVSKDAEYTHNIIGNVILWPKIEIANNNFIIHPTGYNAINFKSSTKIENAECLYENDSNSSTDSSANWLINGEQDGNTSTNPASLAFYVAGEKFINIPDNAQITDINVLIRMGDTLTTDYGALATLHEIYTAQRNIENEEVSYNQMGIKKYTDKSSIPETKINSYTLTNAEVGSWTPTTLKAGQFSIILSASYNKKGLFKNMTLNIYNIDIFVSYALPGTGFSFKSNGTWKNTVAVFKKVDGAWVQQSNPKTLFSGSSTGSESNYIYCGDVSS